MSELPWFSRLLLLDEPAVQRSLDRVRRAGVVADIPNTWQVTLGILRMWHRVFFRSETIGTSRAPVRDTWRARLFALRPLRFPFLLREGAVAPLDFSGLLSSRERVIRHLLGAHHDANQFVYDLEMLCAEDGALSELHERTKAVLREDTAHARFLKDLVVHEGYHASLLAAVERVMRGDLGLSEAEARDPDISFRAYLAWCARQPKTFEQTVAALREGRFLGAT